MASNLPECTIEGDMKKAFEAIMEAITTAFSDSIQYTQESFGAKIAELKLMVHERDQKLLANDIEITGVPESIDENLFDIVLIIAAKVGVQLIERDIISAIRVGVPRNGVAGKAKASKDPRPRPIVVRLARPSTRKAMLVGARSGIHTATPDELGIGDNFHIYERLTKYNRQLLRRAREMASLSQWRYVWSRGGKIYTRRNHGEQRYQLRSLADFDSVFGYETLDDDVSYASL